MLPLSAIVCGAKRNPLADRGYALLEMLLPMNTKSSTTAVPGYVNLDRRFQPLSESNAEQLEVLDMFPEYKSGLTWADLLLKRRVVILAEAGSGKTKELEHQSDELNRQGKFSFFAALEEVGTRGLEQALLARREAFVAWRASDAKAWFFLDSIDEAKKARVRLSQVLDAIAHDLRGCEARAHIVLSGRHSDWDFQSDLARVDVLLEVPHELVPVEVSEASRDQLVSQIAELEDEEQDEQKPEKASVLVMLPLDEARVRTFALDQKIAGVDQFLAQLKANSLMGLARRPLDLRWLSDYWRSKRAFGSLSQMLELSLRKLSTEERSHAPVHASLSADEALEALDRVGAALVLQKLEHVLMQDEGLVIQPQGRNGILLNNVLGKLAAKQTAELLGRPVFIPVTDGVVRLAQDNNGAVRSLLAARWLRAQIEANCPRTEIRGLLFATVYGESVVIPSMQQTAAWLAIWDDDTARELASRDPEILIQMGDPASLSDSIAVSALRSLVTRLAKGDRDRVSDFDQVRRLMRPALVPVVRELWNQYKNVEEVRSLLVKCIHHGRLSDLADIALRAATEFSDDILCTVFGGRAVLALAPKALVQRLVTHVRTHSKSLPATMVWEVAEAAFPADLTVDDIVGFLVTLDEPHGEMYFQRFLRSLEAKRVLVADLLRILSALASRLPEGEDDAKRDHGELARALAELCATVYSKLGHEDPPPELNSAFLRVNAYERMRKPDEPLRKAAHATPARRRALLWAAVDVAAKDGGKGRPSAVWNLHWIHYGPPLVEEDLDWLLDDVRARAAPEDRRLAADAVLRIIAGSNDQQLLLTRAREAAGWSAEMASALEAWDRPRVPSAEELKFEAEQAAFIKEREQERATNEQSWRDFFDRIRANPSELRNADPFVGDRVDARIYDMWTFVSRARKNRDRYAIEHLQPLEKLIGSEATVYFRQALSRFWRKWVPTLRSVRKPDQRNSMVNFDIIGIAGVTLEAVSDPRWAEGLTEAEARKAAEYATLELNGFPKWIDDLAARWPAAVREILGKELEAEFLIAPALEHLDVLQDVAHASLAIQALTADTLFKLLVASADLPVAARGRIIAILQATSYMPRELGAYLLRRTRRGRDPAVLAADLDGLFRVSPQEAVGALRATLGRIAKSKRNGLMRILLASICGDGWGRPSEVPATLPFRDLLDLTKLTFAHLRARDGLRTSGRAARRGSSTRIDDEHIRNVLIGFLAKRPGRAAYDAFRSLSKVPHSLLQPSRALYLARQRAEADSEFGAWTSEGIARFESEHTYAPRSSEDLCRHALAVIENLQHKSIHGAFQPGRALAKLDRESLVQNWVADRFESQAADRYSVERESHSADEKEPDVTLRVSRTQASTPIEIKVAGSWSVKDLERALRTQLVHQYLRDQDHRWGILLLVHLRPKAKGWRSSGRYLSFSQVVARLSKQAQRLAGRDIDAPQPTVAVLDVSTLAKRQVTATKKANKRKRSHAKAKGAPRKTRTIARGRHGRSMK